MLFSENFTEKRNLMFYSERQKKILQLLQKEGNLSIDKLAAALYVSLPTIRRDLQGLEEEGKVIRMDITTDYKPSMLGISYWNHEDCIKIRERIHEKMKNSENYINPKYYWDNIPIEMFEELTVTTLEMNPELVDEMDTVENYQDICLKFERNLNKAGK